MKLVFHIPSFCIIDGSVSACDTSDFKRELAEAFAGYFFIVPAKRFIRGSEFPFELLVVYETDENYYSYIKIFHELVCKYHSELKQDCYYYEQDDLLIRLEARMMKAVDLVRGFCKENEDKYSIYEQYSGRGMFGRNCVGIIVKQGYSCMQMLIELTRFFEANDFGDVNLELEGVSMDELGLNKIVYFPAMEG